MPIHWPSRLLLVRHGQSAGNVARDAAHAVEAYRIDLPTRDADVPLSDLGKEQSRSLGQWLAEQPAGEQPEIVLVSPYLRARQTADLIARTTGVLREAGKPAVDERLREKEFGILDGLTTAGIAALHPEQTAFRKHVGKFYHRPPGGES